MAQLSLKKTIARLLRWTEYPNVKRSTADTSALYTAQRTDTNTTVSFGVGSGGITHGVYSGKLGKWILNGDDTTVYVNGVAMRKIEVTVTKSGSAWTAGNIKAWYNSGAVTVQFNNVSIGTITARTTIATIPAGYRPPTEMYGRYSNTAYAAPFYVEASGEIRVDSGMSGKTGAYGCVTYIAWQ